jgi:hypothetical protein
MKVHEVYKSHFDSLANEYKLALKHSLDEALKHDHEVLNMMATDYLQEYLKNMGVDLSNQGVR